MYSKHMNYNDVSNAAAMDGFTKLRKRDWSSSVMMWLISMLIGVNGKKVFESASGKSIGNEEWRERVMDSLTRWNAPCELRKGKVGSCRSCRHFFGHLRRPREQIWVCFRCQNICKQCDADGSRARYANRIRNGEIRIRHTYFEGQAKSFCAKRDRKAVENKICAQGIV
jgi:hypothetical protein